MNTKPLDCICLALVIIGAIIWGLIGFFNFNLIEAIFGFNWIARIIYALVGLSGLYCLTLFGRIGSSSDN